VDPLLDPFLSASDERTADQRLGDLLQQHAAPLVRRIVAGRLGQATADIDDVSAQVLLQLMVRLRQARADAAVGAIGVFASYVATTARHGCDQYLRSQSPLRWRLRSRILYVLAHDPRVAAWRAADGAWICGQSEWRGQPPTGSAPAPAQLADIPAGQLRPLLLRICALAGGPIDLPVIVELAAASWNIPRRPLVDEIDVEALSDPGRRADAALEQLAWLTGVWAQIRALPLRQRHALLLNLRDDALSLFLTSGVASLRDIAAVLEMPVEALAELWNALPLADTLIAARLGCTRQQVINLRMSARKRLGYRLSGAS
jgi:hypothetical protein